MRNVFGPVGAVSDRNRRGLFCTCACLIGLALSHSADSTDHGPVVAVSPTHVEICAGRSAVVRVSGSNFSPTDSVKLQWVPSTNADVSLSASQSESATNDSSADRTWLVTIGSPKDPLRPGIVHFYASRSLGGKTERFWNSELEVKAAPAADAPFPVKISVHFPARTLSEGALASLQLEATSSARSNIEVTPRAFVKPFLVSNGGSSLPASMPSSQSVTTPRADGSSPAAPEWSARPATIAPGGTFVWLIEISGAEAAPRGPHVLRFEADVSGEIDACMRKSTLTAYQEVSYEALGESTVLNALGISSLLVLPGFLLFMPAIMIWQLNCRRCRPRRWADRSVFPYQAKSVEFWILAVSVSLVSALLIRRFVPTFFSAYGLEQITGTWLTSLVVGLVGYSVFVRAINYYDDKVNPAFVVGDGPLVVLRKHVAKTNNLMVMTVTIDPAVAKISIPKGDAFKLDEIGANAWIGPGITYQWNDQGSNARLRDRVATARRDSNATELWKALSDAKAAGALDVFWSAGSDLKNLRYVPAAGLKDGMQKEFVTEAD